MNTYLKMKIRGGVIIKKQENLGQCPILVDTFIELFVEVVNKLKHKSKDIGDIFDDLPESDEVIIED